MKKNAVKLSLLALWVMTLAACQVTPEQGSAGVAQNQTNVSRLDSTSWHVKGIDGNDIIFNAMITIAFNGGQVSGVAGCNSYSGSLAPSDGDVMFNQISSTRRACEPALMDQEQTFLHTMAAIESYRIEQDTKLMLFDVEGNLRVRATLNEGEENAQAGRVPQDAVASQESVFHCDESIVMRVKFVGPETITMQFEESGESSILSRVRSASGARYQNARYEFWNRGEEARLTDEGQEFHCQRHH